MIVNIFLIGDSKKEVVWSFLIIISGWVVGICSLIWWLGVYFIVFFLLIIFVSVVIWIGVNFLFVSFGLIVILKMDCIGWCMIVEVGLFKIVWSVFFVRICEVVVFSGVVWIVLIVEVVCFIVFFWLRVYGFVFFWSCWCGFSGCFVWLRVYFCWYLCGVIIKLL